MQHETMLNLIFRICNIFGILRELFSVIVEDWLFLLGLLNSCLILITTLFPYTTYNQLVKQLQVEQ